MIEILTPVCDCSLLDWDLPVSQNFATTVLKIPSDEFTIDMATVNEDSKSASPKIRACYIVSGPSCDETTVMQAVVNDADDIFPTFMYRQAFTNVIQINSDSNDQVGSYTLKITHDTVDEGDLTYSTVIVNIANCIITHIDPPTLPVSDSYIVFSGAYAVTTSPEFTQVPACGYNI